MLVEELLREAVDGPTLVRVEGDWPDRLDTHASDALRRVAAVVVAVGAPAPIAPDAFDLLVDHHGIAGVEAAYRRAPIAAVAGAVLLRSAPRPLFDGLVTESATYSALQAGPEFLAWRASRPRVSVPDPTGPRVRVDEHDGHSEIVLVRSDRHNAIDVRMRDELHGALVDAARTHRPIVLRAEGPSFCSGGDLDEFATFPDPAFAHVVRLDRSLAAAMAAIADRLVAAVHGACLGAGIELPAFARHVIAAEDTRFGLPEQSLGLVPGAGGTVSIPHRAGRHVTLAMLLRDGTVDAEHARTVGLVDEVVPLGALPARARAAAATFA